MEKIQYTLPKEVLEYFQALSDAEMQALMWYTYAAQCCLRLGYTDAAKYFLTEAMDEFHHHQILTDYVHTRGGELEVSKTDEPELDAKDFKGVIEAALQMEIDLAKDYNKAAIEVQKIDVMSGGVMQQMLDIQKYAIDQLNDIYTGLNADEGQYEFQKMYFAPKVETAPIG